MQKIKKDVGLVRYLEALVRFDDNDSLLDEVIDGFSKFSSDERNLLIKILVETRGCSTNGNDLVLSLVRDLAQDVDIDTAKETLLSKFETNNYSMYISELPGFIEKFSTEWKKQLNKKSAP